MDVLNLQDFTKFLRQDRELLTKIIFTMAWGGIVFFGWAYLFGWALQIVRWVSAGYTQHGLPKVILSDWKAQAKYGYEGMLWQVFFILYFVPALLLIWLAISVTGTEDLSSAGRVLLGAFLLAYLFSVGPLLYIATVRYAATNRVLCFLELNTNISLIANNFRTIELSLLKVALGIAVGVSCAVALMITFIGIFVMVPVTMIFVAYTTGKLSASLNMVAYMSLPAYAIDDSYE